MSMFERARAAWEIQRESERVARTEEDRKLRDEFAELLQKLTGVSDFTVLGCGDVVLCHHRQHLGRADSDRKVGRHARDERPDPHDRRPRQRTRTLGQWPTHFMRERPVSRANVRLQNFTDSLPKCFRRSSMGDTKGCSASCAYQSFARLRNAS
jgi:hypothetical protein